MMKIVGCQGSHVYRGWNHFLRFFVNLCVISDFLIVCGSGHVHGYFPSSNEHLWEDVHFKFLSKVDSKLHSNDFHVIQAAFPGRRDASYIIHLRRAEELFHVTELGLEPEEHLHMRCAYSGTVTKSLADGSTESGIVSLASCHYELGFEGLVLLPSEQYYIRPSTSHLSGIVRRSTTTSSKPTVTHQALKVNGGNGTGNGSKPDIVDVIHMPSQEDFKEIEKYSNMKPPQGSNSSLQEEEEEGSEDTAATTPGSANKNNGKVKKKKASLDVGQNSVVQKQSLSLPSLRKRLQKASVASRIPSKTAKSKSRTSSSSKVTRVVEIAVFTDEKLYKIWSRRYPKDTNTKMNQYVLAVINNMNALYKQPSFTEALSFRLVHLEIATSKPSTLNENGGHATKYLKSFCAYAAEKNKYGSNWDHALLLSGLDLAENGNNNTAGIAWFSTMCINGLSCSVIEGATFASTFITSHEIGHSLGMDHDGAGQSTSCDSNSYIMSPTTGGGKTDWSKCSIRNMLNFFSRGYKGNPTPSCLTKKGNKADTPIRFKSSTLPGQQFNANVQCSSECKGCTPHMTNSKPYNDICHLLYCQQKQSNYYSLIRSTHPALEGTSCGNGKTCKHGRCQ